MKIPRLADTGEWTARRYLSLLGNVLIWIIVAIDAWYLWPTQLGGDTSIVVVSGKSMEPTYFSGDLVIARKMEPSVGDVIVYAPEGLGGSQVVHRIIGGSADEGWQMRGDNNDFVDPFTPQDGEVKGVVLVHYSNFGRVTVLLLNPMVWAFVLLAAMALMLWWTGDDCDDRDDDERRDTNTDDTDGDPESESEEEPDLIDRVVEGTEAAIAHMVASVGRVGVAALGLVTRRIRQSNGAATGARHAAPKSRFGSPAYLRSFAMVALLGVVAVFGPTSASASQLTVHTADQVFAKSYEKCDDLALSATTAGDPSHGQKWYDQVSISGVTSQCENRPMTVSMYTNQGSVPETTPVDATLGTQIFDVGEYHSNHVNTVVVKIDGWLFLASWSADPPPPPPPPDPAVGACEGYLMTTGEIPPDTACSLVTNVGGLHDLDEYNGGPGHYREIGFATAFSPASYFDGPTYIGEYQAMTLWRVTFDLTSAPYGTGLDLSGGYYLYNYNTAALAPGEDCSDPSSVTLQERTASSGPGANVVVSDAPIAWMSSGALLCSHP